MHKVYAKQGGICINLNNVSASNKSYKRQCVAVRHDLYMIGRGILLVHCIGPCSKK